MKVLLVNPNRFNTPPAPPIGLEYLAACLVKAGHEVRVLDLCFSEDARADMDRTVTSFMPEIAGVTVRNIDSVVYYNNKFYLDVIRDVVQYLKTRHGLTVIIGGAGLPADPEGILGYLGADHGVVGPAEGIINDLLTAIRSTGITQKIYAGHVQACSPSFRRSEGIDYKTYYDAGGIAGFETHKGCSSSCIYCIEANSPVAFKRTQDVVQEIRGFVDNGYRHFHLCDPEFNEDLDHSLEFCTALKQANTDIQWSVYMKPANYNQKLFRLMKETGVYLITLTVDSFKKCALYWADVEKMTFHARSVGIQLVVDFLTGFPYEDEDLLKWGLDFFRRLQPDRVNINTYIRLYRSLAISKIIMGDIGLKTNLLGDVDDASMIRPVFYNQIQPKRLRELIGGDKLFRIEGTEQGVNYTRI
jgi:tryptophan 2-C-methyltransferase